MDSHGLPGGLPLEDSYVEVSNEDAKEEWLGSEKPVTLKAPPKISDEQFKTDLAMVQGAIKKPGQNAYSAEILKKIYTLLNYGGLHCYKEGDWQPWDKNDVPLASILCHGARVTVQISPELNQEVLQWLFEDKQSNFSRSAATHGIKVLKEDKEAKKAAIPELSGKFVIETKVPWLTAAMKAARYYLASAARLVGAEALANLIQTADQHFGVDIALGGAGERHPHSSALIDSDGTHGHLYIYYRPGVGQEPSGMLLGFEQSAPGKPNQFGVDHDMWGSSQETAPTGGTNFVKSKEMQEAGPSRYYDGLYLDLTKKKFETIRSLEFIESMFELPSKAPQSEEPTLLPYAIYPNFYSPDEEKESPLARRQEEDSKKEPANLLNQKPKAEELLPYRLHPAFSSYQLDEEEETLSESSVTPDSDVISPILELSPLLQEVKKDEYTEQEKELDLLIEVYEPGVNNPENPQPLDLDEHIRPHVLQPISLAPQQKIPAWKIALACVGIIVGLAALCIGVGFFAGLSIGITTPVAGLLIVGGVSALLRGGRYAYTAVTHEPEPVVFTGSQSERATSDLERQNNDSLPAPRISASTSFTEPHGMFTPPDQPLPTQPNSRTPNKQKSFNGPPS